MHMKMVGIAMVLGLLTFIGVTGIEQKADAKTVTNEQIEIITEPIAKEEKPTVIEVIEKEEPTKVINVWTDIPLTAEEQIALYEKCQELGINYWFIIALCESESNFDADAVGDKGNSVGYMQINKCNWKHLSEEYGLDVVNNPIDNLIGGAVLFAELRDKYDSIAQVVMGYKCGESRARQLLQNGIVLDCVEELTNRSIELQNTHMSMR